MSRLKAVLSIYNDCGFCADIEDADSFSFRIATKPKSSAKATCIAAAVQLETLARRFRALAETERPTLCDTQAKINRIPAAELT